jgi:signal recognition particle receptor subunit beta
MASINRHKRELLFKLVFYGPGLGGKTTTLRYIHSATKPEHRGNLVSLATDTDRTLYFDYLPVQLLRLGEMSVKLLLYTVPGQVYYAATRKLVLNGVDGIVFVADTQSARLDANQESLDDLNANLADQGKKLSAVPHAFQWNKRDLPDVVRIDELDRRFNLFGAPAVATVATNGQGVFETLEQVTRAVIEAYRADLPPSATKGEGVPLLLDAEEIGLAEAIRGLADSRPARPASNPRRAATAAPAPAATPLSPGAATPDTTTRFAEATPEAIEKAHEKAQAALPPVAPIATPIAPSAGSFGFSLAELWPSADREGVRRIEQALATGDTATAVAASEDLFSRTLAAGSVLLGGQTHPRDPVLLVTLLGLEGPRYLTFRSVSRALRARRAVTQREALECYLFVAEARRALDRATRA